jgi:hypothetical protein
MKLSYTGKVISFSNWTNNDSFNVEGRLSLTNNDGDEFAVIDKTDLVTHDIEHLLYGLGYSHGEERRIFKTFLATTGHTSVGVRQPLFDVKEWENLFDENEDFFLCDAPFIGVQFTVTCSLENRKVTVEVTYH